MKNRTLIGIICIVFAVAVTFVVSPLVNRMTEGKIKVIALSADVTKGSKILEKDISVVEVTRSALPENAIRDKALAVGKYANSDLYKGDILTPVKLTDNANSSENILSSLGDKVAMSISISSFAGGLSGKLQNGDIVSIAVTEKGKQTVIPPTLKYVRVITTTTSGGVDENNVVPNEDGTFDLPTTITVLVSVKQAMALAGYEKNATMHVALVYRGDEEQADKYIKAQDDYIKSLEGSKKNV